MYSCLALALASQETGMGSEVGYMEENTGFGKIVRGVKKFGHVLIGGGSASSGLTQMKINDFVNKKLSDDEVKLLKSLGVKAFFLNTNNLFDNPDKAAAATIVVLNLFAANYDEYKNMLKNNHEEIGKAFTDSLTEAERIALGEQKIAEIMEVYVSVPNDVKSELRNAFKDWLKSANDTTLATYKPGDELNEEKNLQEFNEILMKYGFKEPIKQEDLNYIRYYLTSDSQELSLMEYCAYAWNKGIGETGMQLDRTLIDKIGIIFANPEDFDYDQFTVNVVTLAEMYAQQIGIDNFD